MYFNVSITSRELQTSRLEILTSRLGLVSAGEANVSVSGGERLGLISVSSFYVSCPSLVIYLKQMVHTRQWLLYK